MASNEGHIHWSGLGDETVNFLEQELQLTSEVSNVTTVKADPVGAVRIRAQGSSQAGLALPTEGWEVIPGTNPVLEARADGNYMIGYIRLRLA
jgi:hypothetical protein